MRLVEAFKMSRRKKKESQREPAELEMLPLAHAIEPAGDESTQPLNAAIPDGQRRTDELVVGLALEVWRLRRRVERLAGEHGEDVVRPLRDSLQRLDDIMDDHQLELQNHDGQRYVTGSSLDVIHIRAQGESMVVVETIQPTVRYPDRILRVGQVVIDAATGKEEQYA